MNQYEIESDLRLIVAVTKIGISEGRLQHPIDPGRVGLLVVGGRIWDRNGTPHVYTAGERPAMVLFASRLYGIPGAGHVDQHVIEFAQKPGRVTLTIKHVLLGLSRGPDDPAAVKLHADLKLADPVKLLEQASDWQTERGQAELNGRLVKRVKDAAEASVLPWMQDLSTNPTYLTVDNLSVMQRDFRGLLAATFRDWGIETLDSLPPSRKYPDALTKVVFDVRLGAVEFDTRLRREMDQGRVPIGLRVEQAQRLLALGPAGAFIDAASNSPAVAIEMVEAAGQQAANTARIIRTLLATQGPDADISRLVLYNALNAWQQAPVFPGGSGVPGVGTTNAGLPGLSGSPAAGIPGMGGMGEAQSLPFIMPFPTASGAQPLPGSVQPDDAMRLAALVDDEIARVRQLGAEVDELGAPKNSRQMVEITVDGAVTFRLDIGLDFSEHGPHVQHVVVRGTRKRPEDEPDLLPAWRKGDHLDTVVKLVRSEYFQ